MLHPVARRSTVVAAAAARHWLARRECTFTVSQHYSVRVLLASMVAKATITGVASESGQAFVAVPSFGCTSAITIAGDRVACPMSVASARRAQVVRKTPRIFGAAVARRATSKVLAFIALADTF